VTDLPAVTARPAQLTDTDAIGELHVRTWRAAYPGLLPEATLEAMDARVQAAMWTRVFRPHARTRLLVAERAGVVVGFAAYGPNREDDLGSEAGELYAIYVSPEAWGTGAGHALMTEVIGGLRALGKTMAVLRVLDANERARRFYEREGWTFDRATEPYEADGVDVPEVRYRRSL
jgi:ribosomal protein S18 acetylase RimI-like enzyme